MSLVGHTSGADKVKLVFTTLLLIIVLIAGIVGYIIVQAWGLRQFLEYEL